MPIPVPKFTHAKTYPDAPHEYIRREWPGAAAYYDLIKELVKLKGVREKFTLRGKTYTYKYYYAPDGYKYWVMGYTLNRAKIVPDPNPQTKLSL